MKTTGNTVLITGAGNGMGLEAAKQLSARNNQVIMVARNRERLEAEGARISHASTFVCDISDEAQVNALVDHLRVEHPGLNVIFLNSGIANHYSLFGDEDAFAHAEAEMATNYLSAVRLTRALEPHLAEQPEAATIITTSGAAFAPDIQYPTYSATKAALHTLVQSIRLVLQRRESTIKVFELMAPLVDSAFSREEVSDQKMPPEKVIEALLDGLARDELELRVGLTEDVYQALRNAPDGAALLAVNAE